MKIRNKLKSYGEEGSMLVVVLTVLGILLIIAVGILGAGVLQNRLNIRKVSKAQALYIAEAGVNYYRWVLYHDPYEYCNKETCKNGPEFGPYGPYSYSDSSALGITGFYQLYIIPPSADGSNIVTIRSVGWPANSPEAKRTVEVRCGMPSWSSYSVLSDDTMDFSSGVEVWGGVHSNKGIRFDGIANNLITSAVLSYVDPEHGGSAEFGVHTHSPLDPLPDSNNPPENVPNNSSVFRGGRSFPVLPVSFNLLSSYIYNAYGLATTSGLVLPKSNKQGYHIILKADDTIDIKKVETVSDGCKYKNGSGPWITAGTEKILSESNYIMATTTPKNGLLFVKDKVWVDGTINGNRITIMAFEDPINGGSSDIILNGDIKYTNYNGTDAIGLIAQRNIKTGLYSSDTLRIDAAMIAKEGIIGREYFPNVNTNDCSKADFQKNELTIFGSQAMRLSSVFAYADGSGYQVRNYIYDSNLTYNPPPHFPTTGEYIFISWSENK